MAWVRNFYACPDCSHAWEDEWSCRCQSDCPACGCRHVWPEQSDDLRSMTEATSGGARVIYSSPADRAAQKAGSARLSHLRAAAANDLYGRRKADR